MGAGCGGLQLRLTLVELALENNKYRREQHTVLVNQIDKVILIKLELILLNQFLM